MLNRTNRTLSATLNRLNLGTRSLAQTLGAVNGKTTLRSRHAHGHPMRDGMFGSFDPSIRPSRSWVRITDVPGSPSDEPWPVEGTFVRTPVDVPVTPVVSDDGTALTGCPAGASQGQPQARLGQPRRDKHGRNALKAKRSVLRNARSGYQGDTARTAAAAIVAAAGG